MSTVYRCPPSKNANFWTACAFWWRRNKRSPSNIISQQAILIGITLLNKNIFSSRVLSFGFRTQWYWYYPVKFALCMPVSLVAWFRCIADSINGMISSRSDCMEIPNSLQHMSIRIIRFLSCRFGDNQRSSRVSYWPCLMPGLFAVPTRSAGQGSTP